ncbi:pilus assembly protein PilX [Variovorax sp. J22P271]|uniref:pilus assembly protein PilX n=1 Tax=Variovorax davisae TaxID=3053515 RepID=UPI002574B013|nr:pilus assembly protein PilX [Variovorax sp. J22P271]MDM0035968.1 pilus assembly protein PilX [Variovorax sp. J22P271]
MTLSMHKIASLPSSRLRLQRGVSLVFALLALVALSLATLALVRSVDTGTLLLGNIGFKQDATAAADQAARQAINWLTLNNATLNTDIPANGYYASTQELAADGVTVKPPIDATGQQSAGSANRQLIDWDGNGCKSSVSGSYTGCTVLTADAGSINGNATRYVVFRLCSKPGDFTTDTTITCAQRSTSTDSCGSKGGKDYSGGAGFACSTASAYYRVVVRVLGARNTASYTETIVHF